MGTLKSCNGDWSHATARCARLPSPAAENGVAIDSVEPETTVTVGGKTEPRYFSDVVNVQNWRLPNAPGGLPSLVFHTMHYSTHKLHASEP
jgi:hypothetical protein